MTTLITEFQAYKDRIPEFIVKLYHILESKQYSEYLTWYGDGEVLIKNGKKLQQKVLPHFFRHRHLSSFIRQLNMYKFSKVNKLTKQKNYMYFRNEHFKRGQIKEMVKIKRNNKKNRSEENPEEIKEEIQDSEISLNRELEDNALLAYKNHVKNQIKDIMDSLKKIENNFPQTKVQLEPAVNLCKELLQTQEIPQTFQPLNIGLDQNTQNNKNMLSTMRLIPRLQSLIFPSQCSFYHFAS